MRTPWTLLVDVMSKSFRKRSRLHRKLLWSYNTSATTGTDGPADDSQQGPEHTEARPRADSSAVADSSAIADKYDVADLEQTSLRARERVREKLHTARIGSRGIGARRAGSTRVKESKKAPSRQARRQRGTKPGQQRRPHYGERLYTETSKEETSFSRRCVPQRKIQDHGNGHPSAMQERSVKNMTRNRI